MSKVFLEYCARSENYFMDEEWRKDLFIDTLGHKLDKAINLYKAKSRAIVDAFVSQGIKITTVH